FWRLYLRNVAGFVHHKTDKGTFGNTWRVVLAENEPVIRKIGWTTVAEDNGVAGDSAVTISRYTGGGVIASVFGSRADQMISYLGGAIARDVGWELIFTVRVGHGTQKARLILRPLPSHDARRAGP